MQNHGLRARRQSRLLRLMHTTKAKVECFIQVHPCASIMESQALLPQFIVGPSMLILSMLGSVLPPPPPKKKKKR